MFFPYTVDVPMARVPFANWGLIGVTVVISIASFFPDRQGNPISPLALQPNAFEPTQMVSHVLVHADIWHLVGNMAFLFVFGNAVNAKVGHVSFLGFYFLLGALAGVAWLVLGRGLPAVGASGAIMGIVGIFFVLFPSNEVTCWWGWGWHLIHEIQVPSWIVILFYLGCDLIGAFYNSTGAVAYVSHLAGAIGGVALAATLLAGGWFKPTKYEENLLQMLGFKENRRRKRLEEV